MQRRYYLSVFVLLLLGLGLGYAAMSTNLNITGTTVLKDNRWDIHLENVQVTTGSVSATTPTINTAKDTVTYSVDLNNLGDYFEFTVDCKNDGSLDGMISNISSTLNSNPITNLPTALSYSVTYADGIQIENNHLLEKNDKVTFKIRVGYRTDINISDIPSTSQTLNLAFTVTYIQATGNAIPKPEPDPPAYYTTTSNFTFYGDPIADVNPKYNNYNDAITAFGHPFFIKLETDENENISAEYVGFLLNNTPYYVRGARSDSSIYYEANKATIINAFGSSNCVEDDNTDYLNARCLGENMSVSVFSYGYIEVIGNSHFCSIDNEIAHCDSF